MKPIIKLIREINSTFRNLIVFSKLLNTVLIFLGVYLVLAFFKVYPLTALAPALIYFFVASYMNVKKKHYKDVEKASPEISEKLRTAVDNLDVDNIFVSELQKEVVTDARHVKVSSFFNTKDTSYKMLGAITLCFVILFVSVFGWGFDLKELFKDTVDKFIYREGGDGGLAGAGNIRIAGEGGSDDIYGPDDIAELGDRRLDAVINPIGYEIDLDEIGEPQTRHFPQAFPTSVETTYAGSYEDDIPEEQQEIVKTYFNKITRG